MSESRQNSVKFATWPSQIVGEGTAVRGEAAMRKGAGNKMGPGGEVGPGNKVSPEIRWGPGLGRARQ